MLSIRGLCLSSPPAVGDVEHGRSAQVPQYRTSDEPRRSQRGWALEACLALLRGAGRLCASINDCLKQLSPMISLVPKPAESSDKGSMGRRGSEISRLWVDWTWLPCCMYSIGTGLRSPAPDFLVAVENQLAFRAIVLHGAHPSFRDALLARTGLDRHFFRARPPVNPVDSHRTNP